MTHESRTRAVLAAAVLHFDNSLRRARDGDDRALAELFGNQIADTLRSGRGSAGERVFPDPAELAAVLDRIAADGDDGAGPPASSRVEIRDPRGRPVAVRLVPQDRPSRVRVIAEKPIALRPSSGNAVDVEIAE